MLITRFIQSILKLTRVTYEDVATVDSKLILRKRGNIIPVKFSHLNN